MKHLSDVRWTFARHGVQMFRSPCVFFLLVLLLLVLARTGVSSVLESDMADGRGHFGTKSRYEDSERGSVLQYLGPPGCVPLQLVGLLRHGRRFPTVKRMLRMQEFRQIMSTGGDGPLAQGLASRRLNFDPGRAGELSEHGARDAVDLVTRFSRRFPELVGPETRIVSSSKSRCVHSAAAAARSLQRGDSTVQPHVHIDDDLMRFFDRCPRVQAEVERRRVEWNSFSRGEHVRNALRFAANKSGIPEELLKTELLEAAYQLCALELSENGTKSPWCDLFNNEGFEVMEYLGDLKHYWLQGPSYPRSARSSCSLLQAIFSHFDSAIQESKREQPRSASAVLYFGHAETLIPLLSLLGLFRSQSDLMAANFTSRRRRLFRTSSFCPYSANLLLVLYGCGGSHPQHRLQLLLNEKPIPFPPCHDATACPYATVSAHHATTLLEETFHAVCENGDVENTSKLEL
uniref:multiple inositol polyphosphate phosphatase 1 n=1 Tax=Myxine glutinosa TaxID=7769 RepID=UPI00358F0F64